MRPPFRTLLVHDVELVDDPIDPDWVLEGTPRARASGWASSPDRTASSFVWDCTAGRFDWYFAEDETVHVVEGSVTVSAPGVEPVTLHAGDAALFHAGTWAQWHVEEYVLKHAVLRSHLPGPLVLLVRVWRRLERSLRLRRHPSASRPRSVRALGSSRSSAEVG